MSDQKPIGELAPTVSRAFDDKDPPPKPCKACGLHHGGVNASIRCLENEIDRLRAELSRIAGRARADVTLAERLRRSEIRNGELELRLRGVPAPERKP